VTSEDVAPPPRQHSMDNVMPFEEHASHVDERFSETRARCRNAVLSRQGLHHLAHYTDCVYDFALDVLNDLQFQTGWMSSSVDRRRNECQRIGRDLSGVVCEVDSTLQYVRTGALIRTVLQGAKGSMYCDRIVPNQYLVGLNLASATLPMVGVAPSELEDAKTADIALVKLVTGFRKRLSLGSENPGGWLSAKPSGKGLSSGQAEPDSHYSCGQLHLEGDPSDQLVDLCGAEVDCLDLHYVAYVRDGEKIFSLDHLGHEQLRHFFIQMSVENRRRFYHDFCQQFPLLAGRLGRIVGSVIGNKLERVVLDVEQGALYSYRIRTAEFLVGVTIDQSQVAEADDKMARLAQRIRER
jgi:hypothetical protein